MEISQKDTEPTWKESQWPDLGQFEQQNRDSNRL